MAATVIIRTTAARLVGGSRLQQPCARNGRVGFRAGGLTADDVRAARHKWPQVKLGLRLGIGVLAILRRDKGSKRGAEAATALWRNWRNGWAHVISAGKLVRIGGV